MTTHKILVVDDDPDTVDYFASFLEDEGFSVGSAASSTAALTMVDDFSPDAILIDVLMPGRSGLDLLVTLRRHPRWGSTPLVLITGNDKILEDDCQSYLGAHDGVRGPDGVLGKPVDREALLTVLNLLCSEESPSVD